MASLKYSIAFVARIGAFSRERRNGFEAKLFGWLKLATFQEIALWEVPSRDQQWDDLVDAAMNEDVEMLWLLDRTTNTFVSDWRTAPLQFEVQLICGDLMPTLPVQLLDHRDCSLADCAGQLARRADDPDDALMHMHNNIVGVQRRATELLLRGESALAAALFEETLASAPRSSEQVLQNNLAFCLVPDEPERASEILRNAIDAGLTRAVAACNLAGTQFRLGNLNEAGVLVDLAVGRDDEAALLWILTDGGLELCEATTSEAALALRGRLESGRRLGGRNECGQRQQQVQRFRWGIHELRDNGPIEVPCALVTAMDEQSTKTNVFRDTDR
uniref:tetratricopeptide repeat protein n=1 Tax=Ilumatobacter sp. TaxID=1967498 RepID=UPI003750487B